MDIETTTASFMGICPELSVYPCGPLYLCIYIHYKVWEEIALT